MSVRWVASYVFKRWYLWSDLSHIKWQYQVPNGKYFNLKSINWNLFSAWAFVDQQCFECEFAKQRLFNDACRISVLSDCLAEVESCVNITHRTKTLTDCATGILRLKKPIALAGYAFFLIYYWSILSLRQRLRPSEPQLWQGVCKSGHAHHRPMLWR